MKILVRLWISAYTLRRHLGQRKPLRDHPVIWWMLQFHLQAMSEGHKERLAALGVVAEGPAKLKTVQVAVSEKNAEIWRSCLQLSTLFLLTSEGTTRYLHSLRHDSVN